MIDKDVRLYLSNVVSTSLGPLYDIYLEDFENLDTVKGSKRICTLFRGTTSFIENKGVSSAEYMVPYTVCLLVPKDIRRVTNESTSNNEHLENFIDMLSTALEKSNSGSSRPWSRPAIFNLYGYGNEEDPLGIFGEKNFKNMLVFYAEINVYFRKVYGC